MKKIPTVFQRDMTKQPALVTPEVTPGCEWVLAGEGYATRKLDGTCCLIRDGKLYGRREVKPGQAAPADFELQDHDENTGKSFGWVPIDGDPQWKWHLAAKAAASIVAPLRDGTYEAIGPHFQRNPEGWPDDCLIPHGIEKPKIEIERTFDGLRAALVDLNWEGLVFYHPDGRRAKIKLKDYGLRRQ